MLASYYQEAGKAADAERIYWNLYEESEDIGAKIRWASSLAIVAEREGKIDRLVEQFEERRRSMLLLENEKKKKILYYFLYSFFFLSGFQCFHKHTCVGYQLK